MPRPRRAGEREREGVDRLHSIPVHRVTRASGYGSRRSHGQGQSQLEGTIIVRRCVGVAGVIEPWKLACFSLFLCAFLSG